MKNILVKMVIIIIIIVITGVCSIALLQKNQQPVKIAFLGDSITEYGWTKENGYVLKVVDSLRQSGMNIEPIPAGICGNSSKDMSDRLDNDVLTKKPDVMFFMGGINDIWFDLCTIEEFKNNVETIIDKVKQSGAKLYIISITVITEDLNNPKNLEVDEYNKVLKELTLQKGVHYIDANKVFKDELKKYDNPENVLTVDGVHLNDRGNELLASTITEEFLKTRKCNFFRF